MGLTLARTHGWRLLIAQRRQLLRGPTFSQAIGPARTFAPSQPAGCRQTSCCHKKVSQNGRNVERDQQWGPRVRASNYGGGGGARVGRRDRPAMGCRGSYTRPGHGAEILRDSRARDARRSRARAGDAVPENLFRSREGTHSRTERSGAERQEQEGRLEDACGRWQRAAQGGEVGEGEEMSREDR